jgi:hypothetical protein
MIIEDEQNTDDVSDIDNKQIDETPCVQISHEHTIGFIEFIERNVNIRDDQTLSQLQSSLIKHIGNCMVNLKNY